MATKCQSIFIWLQYRRHHNKTNSLLCNQRQTNYYVKMKTPKMTTQKIQGNINQKQNNIIKKKSTKIPSKIKIILS